MKFISKLAILVCVFAMLSGCTGTVYNHDKSCSTDYILHPVISVPAAIGACDSSEEK